MIVLAPVLQRERLPFVLTALLAAAGWGVTHVVDRVATTPAVEVRVEELEPTTRLQIRAAVEDGGKSVPTNGRKFVLTNLSRSVLFRDLSVRLDCRHGRNDLPCGIVGVGVTGQPPADSPAWLTPEVHAKLANVPLPFLHPGQSAEVFVTYTGQGTPEFRLADPDPGDTEDLVRTGGEREPVRLVDPSLVTWFVRREEAVVAIASASWACLAIAYLFLIGVQQPHQQVPESKNQADDLGDFSPAEEGE